MSDATTLTRRLVIIGDPGDESVRLQLTDLIASSHCPDLCMLELRDPSSGKAIVTIPIDADDARTMARIAEKIDILT